MIIIVLVSCIGLGLFSFSPKILNKYATWTFEDELESQYTIEDINLKNKATILAVLLYPTYN